MSEKNILHEITEEETTYDCNGRNLPLFIAGPASNKKAPALILVHEIFGLNDHIRDVARRFAAQGIRTFATDLFHGRENMPEDKNDLQGMRAVWEKIPDGELIGDLQVLFLAITKRQDVITQSIGTLGYCMGGAIAFMFACSNPSVAFAIDYYGRVKYPELTTEKPKHPIDYAVGKICPVLGIFSGIDPLITLADVELFEQTAMKYASHAEVKVYLNAPHAFFNDRRDNYREEEAKDAWQLTLAFIDRHMSVKIH